MKDFDTWNTKKKQIHAMKDRLYFKHGEIWWVNFGCNIGFEMDGKGGDFMRPVLVLKKYNKYSFLALPLSTTSKKNQYLVDVGDVDGKRAVAVVSQLRNIDSKRLVNKVGTLNRDIMARVKQKASQENFD